jgi:hypothetical protein
MEGGGHWMGFLQYFLGLRSLGHDVWWLELLQGTGVRGRDEGCIAAFFDRMAAYGLADRCGLLLTPPGVAAPALDAMEARGLARHRIAELARTADLLWNFAGALPPPLRERFRHRVLVDGDPGHMHVSALSVDFGLLQHDAFLTVGLKLHEPDCGVPTLGVTWRPFVPVVYLPLWEAAPDPGPDAPFTSVTHWTWEEVWFDGRVLGVGKREAYLPYVELPQRARRPFELAVNLHPGDGTGDRERLLAHGWRLVHPLDVAGSPADYQAYIGRSRGEFGCPKPIHRILRSGWFSDRSAAYLASGRPVLMEETGFSDRLPTGVGLFAFGTLDEAVGAVAEIDRDWTRHSRAARDLAAATFDSRRCLPAMLAASFAPSPADGTRATGGSVPQAENDSSRRGS